MGGHGGLNILPQKSWHVYRRDNVSKVEKDEAEAKAKEDAEKEKHENEEREYRRQLLLLRRGAGHHAPTGEVHAQVDSTTLQGPSPNAAAAATAMLTAAGSDQRMVPSASIAAAVPGGLQHINFWSEDEARMKAEHPETVVSGRWHAVICEGT